MDLILPEPANPDLVFGKAPNDGSSGNDAIWGDGATFQDRTNCIELVSLHQVQGIQLQLTTDVSNAARTQGRPVIAIALRDALISEIELQTHPNDMPTEQFKLRLTESLWTYSLHQADGQPAAEHTTGWSLARKRSIGACTGQARAATTLPALPPAPCTGPRPT
ncbi:hypothetical protein CLU92_1056 [Janthinobacterium sp. 61]|uniref:hypothetical protein n=1 Tax=Janthinobacterium sp. 61 TaxID=2035209 RepID=UPI000CAD3137|nr:hypothetical protein [Janthinobacterium sp. 61]PKV43737.1 hypothetical protein CLU92_1056 [Janthinobacterium sp. 61]